MTWIPSSQELENFAAALGFGDPCPSCGGLASAFAVKETREGDHWSLSCPTCGQEARQIAAGVKHLFEAWQARQ